MNDPQELTVLFRDAWKAMTSRYPDSFHMDVDGLATHFGNLPLFFLNLSIQHGPITDVVHFDRILKAACSRATRSPHAWLYAVCDELAPEGWQSVAESNAMSPIMLLTGMTADRLTPPERNLPALQFRPVNDEQTYRDVAYLNAAAYGLPSESFECMANSYFWVPDTYGSVAYLDGVPVSTTTAFPVNGTIYIALVATSPEHRGKGYADAVFRHVVEEATKRQGPARITLHATEAGGRLYKTMGFQQYASFSILMPGAAH